MGKSKVIRQTLESLAMIARRRGVSIFSVQHIAKGLRVPVAARFGRCNAYDREGVRIIERELDRIDAGRQRRELAVAQ